HVTALDVDARGHRRRRQHRAADEAVVLHVFGQVLVQPQVEPDPGLRVALREFHHAGGEAVRVCLFDAALLAALAEVAEADQRVEKRFDEAQPGQVAAQLDALVFDVDAREPAAAIAHLAGVAHLDAHAVGAEVDGEGQALRAAGAKQGLERGAERTQDGAHVFEGGGGGGGGWRIMAGAKRPAGHTGLGGPCNGRLPSGLAGFGWGFCQDAEHPTGALWYPFCAGPPPRAGQSPTILRSLMIAPKRLLSSAALAANCVGDIGAGSPPSAPMRSRSAGVARMRLISPFSLAITSAGVPAGA